MSALPKYNTPAKLEDLIADVKEHKAKGGNIEKWAIDHVRDAMDLQPMHRQSLGLELVSQGMSKGARDSWLKTVSDQEKVVKGVLDPGAGGKSKPALLYELALKHFDYFKGSDGKTYAVVKGHSNNKTVAIKSMGFRKLLGELFYNETGDLVGNDTCEKVLPLLSDPDGNERPVYLRVGGSNDHIYIDLGNDDWEAIEITANGWQVVTKTPVEFRRTRNAKALPKPVRGQNVETELDNLFRLINVAKEDRMLVLAWLLGSMRPKGPYAIMTLVAEAGSAKTSTTKGLKNLLSPHVAETRSRPKIAEDVYKAAENDWVLAYDNLSSIPADVSDALCRVATGSGYAEREYYTNLDEVASAAQRPIIINGITDMINRGDLMSRAITVNCPPIAEDKRMTEEDWLRDYEEARPRILGALCDLMVEALRIMPSLQVKHLPRMADFAKLGLCLDAYYKLEGRPESFAVRYDSNIVSGTLAVIEASPIYKPLYRFLEKCESGEWSGKASDLHQGVYNFVGESSKQVYPKTPHHFTGKLREIATNLRTAKIMDIIHNHTNSGSVYTIKKLARFDEVVDRGFEIPENPDYNDSNQAGSYVGQSSFLDILR